MKNSMLDRMLLVFGAPEVEDFDRWLVEVEKALAGFSGLILDRAADHVIRTSKRFPAIAVMRKACEDVCEALPKTPDGEKYPEWSKEAVAHADSMLESDIGRQAADEGWSLALHDYLRVHRRFPDASGIARCKRQSREFDEDYRVATLVPGSVGAALVQLGDAMLAKRYKYADLSHGILA